MCVGGQAKAKDRVSVIIDTDMSMDCDDVAALCMGQLDKR